MKQHTWRDIAKPIIAEVLAENKGKDEDTIRKALREAYPYGERKYHPYKIWLSEIKRQLGRPGKSKKKKVAEASGGYKQLEMF